MILLAALALSACTPDDEFVIDLNIDGLGTSAVEMTYFNRSVHRTAAHAVKGKVRLRGSSDDYTLVEITADAERLLYCVAKNGQTVKATMHLDDRSTLRIKGNEPSQLLGAFEAGHPTLTDSLAADPYAANAAVAAFVYSHPESVASTALLMTRFNARDRELQADSLINILTPQARPASMVKNFAPVTGEQVSASVRGSVKPMTLWCGRDTVAKFIPSYQTAGMIVFTDTRKPDSITSALRTLRADYTNRQLALVEVSLGPDSATWRRDIEPDSATWLQAWTPGGASGPAIRSLAVPATPYYIVTDSTSEQLYRGRSLSQALRTLHAVKSLTPKD